MYIYPVYIYIYISCVYYVNCKLKPKHVTFSAAPLRIVGTLQTQKAGFRA